MPDNIPLVMDDGKVKEMPAGDKVAIAHLATGTPDGTKFIRDDGVLATPAGGGSGSSLSDPVVQAAHGFVVGNVIYRDTAGSWLKADRDNADATAEAVVSAVADSGNFTALLAGKITLTTGEWDAITGDSGGLVDGNHYWLSSTAGGLTTTQPTGLQQFILTAISTTVGIVMIGEPFIGDEPSSGFAMMMALLFT